MLQLLKPGGWLQWIELDVNQASRLLRGDPSIPISNAVQEADELIAGPALKYGFYKSELANIFRKTGFQSVTRELTSTDRLPELRSAAWQMSQLPFELLFAKIAKAEGKSEEYIAERIGQIRSEVKAGGVYYRYDIHVYLRSEGAMKCSISSNGEA
ncbi:hypothetical protein LTR09_008209 [Extremus antarcticus]|uniref:Uncharacterized protein n=1 Tax=Extremus antarcticus TaxID=702011 RepID=A0AAJ0DI11_9PEZI|nr:hypothetical protein LTR09_008209 [Extremus antarcticus]